MVANDETTYLEETLVGQLKVKRDLPRTKRRIPGRPETRNKIL